MAVPAHDERDFAFAKQFMLPILRRRQAAARWLKTTAIYENLAPQSGGKEPTCRNARPEPAPDPQGDEVLPGGLNAAQIVERFYEEIRAFDQIFTDEGTAIHSGEFDGLPTAEFKKRIAPTGWPSGPAAARSTTSCATCSLADSARGEPFPLLHELDETGKAPASLYRWSRAICALRLPEVADYKRSGKAEPPLEKAADWRRRDANGKRYRCETNTMRSGRLLRYHLRHIRSEERDALCDPAKEKTFMPVESSRRRRRTAVLHLYARVLAQGPVRPRPRPHPGAVPAAGQPGHDPGGDGVYRVPQPRRLG